MKTLHTHLLTFLATAALVASIAVADDSPRTKILKERDAVLSQILAEREGRYASGVVDDEAVAAARLALYSFRRDAASSTAEKLKQQELIVAVWQKKVAALKSRVAAGVVGREDVLLATDSLLQAQQVLEELKPNVP